VVEGPAKGSPASFHSPGLAEHTAPALSGPLEADIRANLGALPRPTTAVTTSMARETLGFVAVLVRTMTWDRELILLWLVAMIPMTPWSSLTTIL